MTSISSLEMYFGLICLWTSAKVWVLQTKNDARKGSVFAPKLCVVKIASKNVQKNVDTGVGI